MPQRKRENLVYEKSAGSQTSPFLYSSDLPFCLENNNPSIERDRRNGLILALSMLIGGLSLLGAWKETSADFFLSTAMPGPGQGISWAPTQVKVRH